MQITMLYLITKYSVNSAKRQSGDLDQSQRSKKRHSARTEDIDKHIERLLAEYRETQRSTSTSSKRPVQYDLYGEDGEILYTQSHQR